MSGPGRINYTKENIISAEQNSALVPQDTESGVQPRPWSTPGAWTIGTTAGLTVSGYLPEWAEDDPSETGVPLDELAERLGAVNHRSFFEGVLLPLATSGVKDAAGGAGGVRVEEDAVFEGSIDCNPYDEDARLRVPVVNLQVCVGRWMVGLDPDQLAQIADKLRAQADVLREQVLPALIAARQDWAARAVSS